MLKSFFECVNSYSNRIDTVAKSLLAEADDIMRLPPIYKFKTQIFASGRADELSTAIVSSSCSDEEDFCKMASQWEQFEILANIATPESALAVQTFVLAVLQEQRKMGDVLIMTPQAYWIAFIENLYNIVHQLDHDTRKAYKYALRVSTAIDGIFGAHVKLQVNEETYTKLRDMSEQNQQNLVQKDIMDVIITALKMAFRLAPASVRLRRAELAFE